MGEDVANAINKEIGASNYDSDSGTYSIDCSIQNTGPPLTFNFPGFAISIPAKYYVISDYDSNCISGIFHLKQLRLVRRAPANSFSIQPGPPAGLFFFDKKKWPVVWLLYTGKGKSHRNLLFYFDG